MIVHGEGIHDVGPFLLHLFLPASPLPCFLSLLFSFPPPFSPLSSSDLERIALNKEIIHKEDKNDFPLKLK